MSIHIPSTRNQGFCIKMIGVSVAIYSNHPEPLIKSILESKENIRWYIFYHGNDKELLCQLTSLFLKISNVLFLPYGVNRGLSKSWNDAIKMSMNYGDEFCMIVNDDVHFKKNGFDQFVSFIRNLPKDFGFATVMGEEGEGKGEDVSPVIPQEFACCVIGEKSIETIGFLDQNFTPAYFEDSDYIYRLHKASLSIFVDERTLVHHERSKTLRKNSENKEMVSAAYEKNKSYFIKKWGAEFTHAHYTHPFDDKNQTLYIPYDN